MESKTTTERAAEILMEFDRLAKDKMSERARGDAYGRLLIGAHAEIERLKAEVNSRQRCGTAYNDADPDSPKCDRTACHPGLHCTAEGWTFAHGGTHFRYCFCKSDITAFANDNAELKAEIDALRAEVAVLRLAAAVAEAPMVPVCTTYADATAQTTERLKAEHADALKRQRAEDLERACKAVDDCPGEFKPGPIIRYIRAAFAALEAKGGKVEGNAAEI
jgi:hypothetical protein